MLSEEQRNTLTEMISDSKQTTNLDYTPSKVIWESISKTFQNLFNKIGIDNIQNKQEYNSSFSYVLDIDNDLINCKQIALWSYYSYLKYKDEHGVLDKIKALPTKNPKLDFSAKDIKGRPNTKDSHIINWDYLISMDTIITILKHYPNALSEPTSICEVGAGWGRVAHYFSQLNSKISYNIFDIPHSLLISSNFLKNNSNGNKVFTYQETKINNSNNKKKLLDNPGINFSVPHKLESFEDKSFDLFINIASLQEMNISQVKTYFKQVDRLSNNFYTQQRYEGLDMEYNKYPNNPKWEKLLDGDVNFHPLWFEQFFKV